MTMSGVSMICKDVPAPGSRIHAIGEHAFALADMMHSLTAILYADEDKRYDDAVKIFPDFIREAERYRRALENEIKYSSSAERKQSDAV